MEKKLNLHDVFGILFPGAVLCVCLYYFLFKRWFQMSGGWSATFILLPIAYIMGILIHQLAHWRLHEHRVAPKLMQDEDPTFSPAFKTGVKKAYTDMFKLPADGKGNEPTQMYLLCNDYVIQQGKGIYVENHYAIYSLCRSMVLVSLFSGFAGLISWWIWTGCGTHFVCRHFFVLLLILFSTAVSTLTFWYGKERFIRLLAIAVYRSFYSAYCDLKMPSRKRTASGKDDD